MVPRILDLEPSAAVVSQLLLRGIHFCKALVDSACWSIVAAQVPRVPEWLSLLEVASGVLILPYSAVGSSEGPALKHQFSRYLETLQIPCCSTINSFKPGSTGL